MDPLFLKTLLLHSLGIFQALLLVLVPLLNKSWQQHPTRHQLYGHLPPITKTIQVRRTRHAGHCWRSKDELVSDVLLWTPTYDQAKAGRPARTYIQQLCEDTGCSPEDLPEAMNDREKWRERVSGTTWWWWWCYFHILFLAEKDNYEITTTNSTCSDNYIYLFYAKVLFTVIIFLKAIWKYPSPAYNIDFLVLNK